VDRRGFIGALAGGLLAVPLAAEAQQSSSILRIGYLSGAEPGSREEALRQGLRELGYVEGRNIVIAWRFAEGQEGRLAGLAGDLVRLGVAVIVADGTRVIRALQSATRTIPIVMIAANDPVRSGLVASLAHPGGNITGLANIAPELAGKRRELLKDIIPALSRVAVLWNPGDSSAGLSFKETQAAARALGVQLLSLEARGLNDFPRAFEGAVRGQASALTVLSDALMFNYRMRIVELAAERRLPAVYAHRGWAEAGGLLSYGSDLADLWRRSATYVDKILKGAKPDDLPVQQPTKFELVINLKTAKALGLTIPPSLLQRADQLIE